MMTRLRAYSRVVVAMASLVGVAGAAEAQEPPCEGTELVRAREAMSSAKKALDRAIEAIDRPTAQDLVKLETWLGIRNSADAKNVRDTLVRARVFADGSTFLCSVKTDIDIGDVYAYVRADKAFVITLGAFFFRAPERGFSSRPGVLVHEMVHFVLVGGAKDPKVYGPAEARKLAASDPKAAQQNAENLEYFVEAVAFGL